MKNLEVIPTKKINFQLKLQRSLELIPLKNQKLKPNKFDMSRSIRQFTEIQIKLNHKRMDFSNILDGVYNSLNEVRMNPREAVHNYSNLQQYYNGQIYKQKIKTREGVKALRNLLDQLYLKGGGSSNKLKWSFALHMAADQQASKLGELGLVTTEGTQVHIPLPERCKKYALVRGRISQIYEFGGKNPYEVLEWLLIDDGLISRKRRNTLLDPIYKYIGVGSCFHESHGTVTVIILAEDLISLVAPEKDGKYRIRQPFSQGKQTHYKLDEEIVVDNSSQFHPNMAYSGQQQIVSYGNDSNYRRPMENNGSRVSNQSQNNVEYRNQEYSSPRHSSQQGTPQKGQYQQTSPKRSPEFKRVNSREERVQYNNEGQPMTQYDFYKKMENENHGSANVYVNEDGERNTGAFNNHGLNIEGTPQPSPPRHENQDQGYDRNHEQISHQQQSYQSQQSPVKPKKEESSCQIM